MRELLNIWLELWRTRHMIEVGDMVPMGMSYVRYEQRKYAARVVALRKLSSSDSSQPVYDNKDLDATLNGENSEAKE